MAWPMNGKFAFHRMVRVVWPETQGRVSSEHVIDWFHITLRLTILQQQAKGANSCI